MRTITAELTGEPVPDYANLYKALAEVKSLLRQTASEAVPKKRGSSTRSRRPAKPVRTPIEDLGELAKDDMFEVEGEEGRFKFRRLDDKAVHAWGGPSGHEQSRSFALDRKVYRNG